MLKKISFLIIAVLVFTSCSNELEVNMPGKPLPVVNFILDPYENEYLALVTQTNNIEVDMYQFFENQGLFSSSDIDLTLELWNDSVRLWYTNFEIVEPISDSRTYSGVSTCVYRAEEVIPKKNFSIEFMTGYPDFGFFRIILEGEDFEETAYSKIEFGDYPEIITPSFTLQKVRLYGLEPLKIHWNSKGVTRYFDLYFHLNYKEFYMDEHVEEKTHKFIYSQDVQTSSSGYQIIVNPYLFYSKLALHFPAKDGFVDYRQFESFDIVLVGGDRNFEEYLAQNNFQNESSMVSWSNITNGIGIFALKYVVKKESLRFHSESLDSLATGYYTKDLGFVRW